MFGYVCGADANACAGIAHVSRSQPISFETFTNISPERHHRQLRCLQHVQLD